MLYYILYIALHISNIWIGRKLDDYYNLMQAFAMYKTYVWICNTNTYTSYDNISFINLS